MDRNISPQVFVDALMNANDNLPPDRKVTLKQIHGMD